MTLSLTGNCDRQPHAGPMWHVRSASQAPADLIAPPRINARLIYHLIRSVIQFDIPRWVEEVEKERERAQQSNFYGRAIQKYYERMGPLIEAVYGPFLHFVPYTLFGMPSPNRAAALIALHVHFSRLLKLQPGKRALELGCGHGRLGSWLARYSGADVTGITLGKNEVAEASAFSLPNHRVLLGDFHDLSPFYDGGAGGPFDATLAVYCLKYSTDLDQALAEIRRVLTPDGLFLSYDMWLNENYDDNCPEHRALHARICSSTCMPPLHSLSDALERARRAGLRLVYNVDLATRENHWYQQFLEGHIVHILNSHIAALLIRLAGTFKRGLADIYEGYIVHPTTDLVRAGELGILDTSRILVFAPAR